MTNARWNDYILRSGLELKLFLEERLTRGSVKTLFILAKGFDPRMCDGLRVLLPVTGTDTLNVRLILFDEGNASPSHAYGSLVEENSHSLFALVGGESKVQKQELKMFSEEEERRIGSRSAANLFKSIEEIENYTDIFVDISAMPRGIFFPLLAKLLGLIDEGGVNKPNLYVLASENAELDRVIRDEEVEENAAYVHLFSSGMELESTAEHPRIWIPLLGENQRTQLERIYARVGPDEICPVLPSPSLNPRRGDALVAEHRSFLFDELELDPANFLFASESNPFEVYRQIRKTIVHYKEALLPLGGAKTVLSALSSKLLSMGAFLAAYEFREAYVGVAHVDSKGFKIDVDCQKLLRNHPSRLYGLWLAGECYE